MKKPIEDMFLPISFEVFEYNKPVEDKSEIFHKNKLEMYFKMQCKFDKNK